MKLSMVRAAGQTGLAGAVLRLRRFAPSPWLVVLNYHRVGERDLTLDEGVVDATAEMFDRQMGLVRQHFTPIAIEDLINYVRGEPLPPNPLLVTFDDGYRDNLTVAAPILKRHGIRAAFFVATTFIAERRLFWWDTLSHLAKSSTRKELILNYPRPRRLALGDETKRTIRALLRVVKDTHDLGLEQFIDDVAKAAGVEWTREKERELAEQNIMTWDDVRALVALGMDVESHTRSHRVLHTLRPERLRDELFGSRVELERELGRKVRAISYPVGASIASSPVILQAIADAGYEVGFSGSGGSNHLRRRSHRFDVRRVSIDSDIGLPELTGLLASPNFSLRP